MTKWNAQEKDFVFESFVNGLTASQIGEQLGRTKNSVIALFNRERERRGVSALRSEDDFYTEEDIERARVLWQQGVHVKQIAEALGRNLIDGLFRERRELFPKRKDQNTQGFVVSNRLRGSVRGQEKPTPENTVIQYEFQEYDMPEDALMIPFVDIEAGQCGFLSGNFWDEPSRFTPCCGLPVYDPRGKGLRRTNCEFHYKISIEEVK